MTIPATCNHVDWFRCCVHQLLLPLSVFVKRDRRSTWTYWSTVMDCSEYCMQVSSLGEVWCQVGIFSRVGSKHFTIMLHAIVCNSPTPTSHIIQHPSKSCTQAIFDLSGLLLVRQSQIAALSCISAIMLLHADTMYGGVSIDELLALWGSLVGSTAAEDGS